MAINKQLVNAAALLVLALGATAARESGKQYTNIRTRIICYIAGLTCKMIRHLRQDNCELKHLSEVRDHGCRAHERTQYYIPSASDRLQCVVLYCSVYKRKCKHQIPLWYSSAGREAATTGSGLRHL